MPILSRHSNQLTFIYNSTSEIGKQSLAYIQASKLKLETIDLSKESIANSVWVEIIDQLQLNFKDVFSLSHPDAKGVIDSQDFDTDDWLKIINKNPSILQKPIAINGDKAKVISNASQVLSFFGVDSAGLEKKFGFDPPHISKTTEDDSFV